MIRISGARVLVTGAGGFIGSHLVERLVAGGAEVTAMVHYDSRADHSNLDLVPAETLARVRVVSGDIEDPFFMNEVARGQEIVLHLAALIAIPYSYQAPASFVRANVMGTLNVLEAARAHKPARVVVVSTSETYGTAQYAPIDEAHPLQAQSPYSASKIGAEKLAESYFRSFGLPVTVVRPFNTYGPRQSARAIIPTVITQQLAADRVRVGSLDPIRDFTYVTDTADGLIAVAACAEANGLTLNLGTGREISVRDLVQLIQRLAGPPKPVETDDARIRPDRSEVMRLIADNRKAVALTGWSPRVSLEEGLEKTVAFIGAHRHLYKIGQYAR